MIFNFAHSIFKEKKKKEMFNPTFYFCKRIKKNIE